MTRKFQAMAVMAAVLLAVALTGQGAFAATGVGSVSATPGANSVSVTGAATFTDVPVLVGEDGTGDALIPAGGFDVSTATISRVPGSANLTFTFGVADAVPTANAVPGAMYVWTLAVDGNDVGYWLSASRVSGQPASANPGFALNQTTASQSFSTVAALSGSMANGTVSWTVPLTRINATSGSVISFGNQGTGFSGTITGANGAGYCCTPVDDMFVDDYTVPGPTVQLGIAPAGTPVDAVPMSSNASVGTISAGTGSFSGAVARPSQPGSYVVVAKACYGAGNCGTSSTTITI